MSSSPLAPAVVLVQPREEGNIGAAARAMANMGLDELVLVDPVATVGRVAEAFAVGARRLLDEARYTENLADALAPYRRIVGTTSARGRDPSTPVTSPRDLPAVLSQEAPSTSTALVFGPEISGLDNDQLAHCGLLVQVPCAPLQPTLNLAQAVLIVAYELFITRLSGSPSDADRPPAATAGEIDGLFTQVVPLLTAVGFKRDDTFAGVLRDLRRLAARTGATPREINILRGICRRAQRALERT